MGRAGTAKGAGTEPLDGLNRGFFPGHGLLEVRKGKLKPSFQINPGFPAEQLARLGDVGAALFGVILRKWFVLDSAAAGDWRGDFWVARGEVAQGAIALADLAGGGVQRGA